MPAPIPSATRRLLVAKVDALVAAGIPVRRACIEAGVMFVNFYRWKAENKSDGQPTEPKIKTKRGRKPKFDLSTAEVTRLRFWALVKESIPLAVESFIAEALSGDTSPYFAALRDCVGAIDPTHPARRETAEALRRHWQDAVQAGKPVQWPLSVQRACRVTAQERAEFRGKKHAGDARGMERRGGMIRTEEGELVPWYPGAIYESDDMSSNAPFRFHDAAAGREIVGRQILATIDACPLFWLGHTHIGRDRDSYRAEDIASHFREIVETHGLPLIWRIERGRWDNTFIWGCKIGEDENGKDIRWGGLDEIIHIAEKHTSQGKANVEGGFDLLQSLMDHGFDGRTLSIGRQRGEFELATREMLRANKGDLKALAKFWDIEQSADAVEAAMHLFNTRPKQRQAFGNQLIVPAELRAAAAAKYHKPLPAEHAWRFHAVKMKATVRRGIIEVRAPHYPLSFRFRVHGGSRTPNVHCDNGHEVLIAFTPSAAWEGCHVFNADRTARNRDHWGFGQRMGVAEYMEDAVQEDLHARSYSPGANRAAAAVRKATRILIAGTHFSGRRMSHAQDSFGNQLTLRTQGSAAAAAVSAPANGPRTAAAPVRAPARETIEFIPARGGQRHTQPPGLIEEDFDEAAEREALALL